MSFFDVLWWLLVILYVPACIGLIVIVLLQKGKGTSFAGAFGMGAGSDTVFGPRSRQSLPVRLTYVAATLFMVIALLMSIIAGRVGKGTAPGLVEATSEEETIDSSLSDLGIGTGEVGASTSVNPEELSAQIREALDRALADETAVDENAPDANAPEETAPAENASDGIAPDENAPDENVPDRESSDAPESSGDRDDGAS